MNRLGLLLLVIAVGWALADLRIAGLAANSLALAIAVVAASFALALPLAVLLFRTDLPGRRWWRLVWAMGLLLPLHVQAAAWLSAFGIQGWVTSHLWPATGLGRWLWTIGLHTAAATPWMMLFCGLGLRLAEPELEEMAMLDGPTWWVLRRATLPRARDALAAGALWIGVSVTGEMTVADLFGIRMLAEEIYTQHALGGPDLQHSYLLQILAPAGALALAATLAARAYQPRTTAVSHRPAGLLPLGSSRRPAVVCVAAATALFVGVPLIGLIGRVGLQRVRVGGAWHTHWSAVQAARLVGAAPLEFHREFGWSLAVAALAACMATILAILLAWMARDGGRRAVAAWLVVTLCAATPGPLAGKAMIALLNDESWFQLAGGFRHWLYDRTLFALAAVQTLRGLPIAMLALWGGLRSVPRELLETAALDGWRPSATLVRIVLPMRRRALALGWLGAFVIAFGELPASLLVAPPGVTTLSLRIFELIHFGVNDRVAAICLTLALGALALGLLGERLLDRLGRRREF